MATDSATVNQVLASVLCLLEQDHRCYQEICCLIATAPLRDKNHIINAHELLDPPRVEMVMGVTQYPLPPFQALARDSQGYLSLNWPTEGQLRSQELPRLLVDNGSTYWATTEAYQREHTFYGNRMVGYEMPFRHSIDIDTQEDLDLAEAIAFQEDRKSLYARNCN